MGQYWLFAVAGDGGDDSNWRRVVDAFTHHLQRSELVVVDPQAVGIKRQGDVTVVDADVHCSVPSVTALFPYLPAYWVEVISQSGFSGASENAYPPNFPIRYESNQMKAGDDDECS